MASRLGQCTPSTAGAGAGFDFLARGGEARGLHLRAERGGDFVTSGTAWLWVKTKGIPSWGRCTTHFSLLKSLRDPPTPVDSPLLRSWG